MYWKPRRHRWEMRGIWFCQIRSRSGGGGGTSGSGPAHLLRGLRYAQLTKPSLNIHLPAISHCLLPQEVHKHADKASHRGQLVSGRFSVAVFFSILQSVKVSREQAAHPLFWYEYLRYVGGKKCSRLYNNESLYNKKKNMSTEAEWEGIFCLLGEPQISIVWGKLIRAELYSYIKFPLQQTTTKKFPFLLRSVTWSSSRIFYHQILSNSIMDCYRQ